MEVAFFDAGHLVEHLGFLSDGWVGKRGFFSIFLDTFFFLNHG